MPTVYDSVAKGKIETMLGCGWEIANSLAGCTSTPQKSNSNAERNEQSRGVTATLKRA